MWMRYVASLHGIGEGPTGTSSGRPTAQSASRPVSFDDSAVELADLECVGGAGAALCERRVKKLRAPVTLAWNEDEWKGEYEKKVVWAAGAGRVSVPVASQVTSPSCRPFTMRRSASRQSGLQAPNVPPLPLKAKLGCEPRERSFAPSVGDGP
eukprot:scaffold168744_cov37-Tisochrysis_lutea.AAC.3